MILLESERHASIAEDEKQVGTGDRIEKELGTYDYPQGRVTGS